MNLCSAFLTLFLILTTLVQAQYPTAPTDESTFLTAPGNAGTDFYFSFPPSAPSDSGLKFCKIYVVSSREQTVHVEIKGKQWEMTKVIPQNQVTEFYIAPDVAEPFTKATTERAPAEKVYLQAAVHIYAESPIIICGVNRYENAREGFLILPVSSLGNEYVVSSYPQVESTGSDKVQLVSEVTISAAYDSTEVSFSMGGTTKSETSGGLASGKDTTFLMNKGDVLCFTGNGELQDLSGSYIKSTKPVAVVSGNQCANIPTNGSGCSPLREMELPAFAWGKEYHVTPIFGRKKNPIIRIYAKEKNTTVYRNGEQWLVLPRSSRTIDNGYVERRSFDGAPQCVVITADKPIYVVQYNPSETDDAISSSPFQMTLTPFEQYQNEITFNTPGGSGGIDNFKLHYVNLIYQLAADKNIPGDIEVGQVTNGKFEWKLLNVRYGSTPGLVLPVQVNGHTYAMKTLTLPYDGVFKIRAKSPIAAYSYGFSAGDAYGYPSTVRLVDLLSLDTEKPRVEWSQQGDGSVQNGLVTDYPLDPVKSSRLGLVSMSKDSNYNYQFTVGQKTPFIAGITQSTDWSLQVIDKSKDALATLRFMDRSGNDTTVRIQYKSTTGVHDGTTPTNNVSECSFTLTPNPINHDGGSIEYTLPTRNSANIAIYSSTGEKVVTLVSSTVDSGTHQVPIPVERLSAGVYGVRMVVGDCVMEKSMVIIK
ncbi:MAG: IgGFc-binding protein [Candidatus Kapaibacterium sp.]